MNTLKSKKYSEEQEEEEMIMEALNEHDKEQQQAQYLPLLGQFTVRNRTGRTTRLVEVSSSIMRKTIEEVNAIPAKERNRILELMHGVANDVDRTSDAFRDEGCDGTFLPLLVEQAEAARRWTPSELSREPSCTSSEEYPPAQQIIDGMPLHHHNKERADNCTLVLPARRVCGDAPDFSKGESPLYHNCEPRSSIVKVDLGDTQGKGRPSCPLGEAESITGQASSFDGYHHPHGTEDANDHPYHDSTKKRLSLHSRYVLEKLQELDRAISLIECKPAYNQAQQIHAEFVENQKFRLIFLRAESFDARKAACRLVSFMDEKLQRFGPHALTRQLTMNDLSRNSKSLLSKKGILQVLPTRDSAGRAILVTYCNILLLRDEVIRQPTSLGDAIFYLLSVMAEDQMTQNRGIVTVGIIMSPAWPETESAVDVVDSSLKDLGSTIEKWCPVKCIAHHHWIYDDSKNYQTNAAITTTRSPVNSTGIAGNSVRMEKHGISASSNIWKSGQMVFCTIMRCLGREYRIRTRMHTGSYDEYKKTLKTFGIDVYQLP